MPTRNQVIKNRIKILEKERKKWATAKKYWDRKIGGRVKTLKKMLRKEGK